jgi:hypothetical protein
MPVVRIRPYPVIPSLSNLVRLGVAWLAVVFADERDAWVQEPHVQCRSASQQENYPLESRC